MAVTLTFSGLPAFTAALSKAVGAGLLAAGKTLETNIKGGFSRISRFQPSLPGQPPNIRRGGLHNSIRTAQVDAFTVAVGSNVIYGIVHEKGKIITARRTRYLPVPINEAASRLLEKKGTASLKTQGKFSVRRLPSGKAYLVGVDRVRANEYGRDASGKRTTIKRNDVPVFALKRSVRIPPRPFIRPAFERSKSAMMDAFNVKSRASLGRAAK